MLVGLAWRNIWRQPQRSILSLSSIALSSAITIFLFSLQQGTYGAMKESVLRLVDGFAQVQPVGYADDPDLRKTIADPDGIMRRLEMIPSVSSVAPRALTYVLVSNGPRSYGAALFGVDPAREKGVSTLASTVVKGRPLTGRATDGAIVGVGLARNLKLSPGGKLTLLGAARDGSIAADVLTVQGVFETGSPELDRQAIEMPLTRFQADFQMGRQVNLLAIGGTHLAAIQSNLSSLRRAVAGRRLVVRSWTQLEPALNDVILLDASFSALLYVSLIAIVVFIILNTLLMSVLERTREFGVLMALGMRPSQIGRMIWLELLFLAGIGAAVGISLGCAITAWVAQTGMSMSGAEALFQRWHLPATLYPQLDLTSALAGPVAIAVAIALAGIVPYLRAVHLQPVAAMRSA